MKDFEWISDRALRSELVARCAAGFGIPFAIGAILLASGESQAGWAFVAIAIITCIAAGVSAPPTKISVKGNDVSYGNSMKTNISNIKSIKIKKLFFIEEVIIMNGSNPSNSIPTKGIPENIKVKLISVLNERVAVNKAIYRDAQ